MGNAQLAATSPHITLFRCGDIFVPRDIADRCHGGLLDELTSTVGKTADATIQKLDPKWRATRWIGT